MILLEHRRGLVGGEVAARGERVDRARQQRVGQLDHLAALEEVGEQLVALLGEHRLGVELDALGGQLAVAQRHQHAAAARRLLQAAGQLVADDQGVVAPDGQAAA